MKIRDVSVADKWFILACDDCEERLGFPVEIHVQCGSPEGWKGYDAWMKTHQHEGDELDLRIDSYLPDYDAKVKFAENCYLEDPAMSFDEIRRRWEQVKQLEAEIRKKETIGGDA